MNLKIRHKRVEEAIIILPFWPRRPWFNLLPSMASAQPIKFPLRKDLLNQHLADIRMVFHPPLRMLHLTAYKLTGRSGSVGASCDIIQTALTAKRASSHDVYNQ